MLDPEVEVEMKHISAKELSKKCKKGNIVALTCRDDEENTACSVEICRYISDATEAPILYFSLKEIEEAFRKKHQNLQPVIIDTAAIEVERLVEIVRKKQSTSSISLIVIDYLMLLSTRVDYGTRKEEIESSVRQLKELSVENNVPILILMPLSKYMSNDGSIVDEMGRNGFLPELLDVIAYVQNIDGYSIQVLKDENSYVHYGAKYFVRDKFESIENEDFRNKPDGGFWASSCKAKNSWSVWCVENDFKRANLEECFYFSLSETANVLRIESLEDCKELTLQPVGYMHKEYMNPNYKVIDYKACIARGFDAIEYKYDIACKSEDFEEIDSIMWGWDCDSILILNPDIVVLHE